DVINYEADGLPAGLQIDPDSGVISGRLEEVMPADQPAAVTVLADDGNGGRTSPTFAWAVAPAPLSLTADDGSAFEKTPLGSAVVATFTTQDTLALPSQFTATVDWGDGTTSDARVEVGEGGFEVTADHVFAQPGSFGMTVRLSDDQGQALTATAA